MTFCGSPHGRPVLNSHMPAISHPPTNRVQHGPRVREELAVPAERQQVDAGDRHAMPAIAFEQRALDDAIDLGDQRVRGVVAADDVVAAVLLHHLRPGVGAVQRHPLRHPLVHHHLRRVVPDAAVVAIELGDRPELRIRTAQLVARERRAGEPRWSLRSR